MISLLKGLAESHSRPIRSSMRRKDIEFANSRDVTLSIKVLIYQLYDLEQVILPLYASIFSNLK